MTANAWFPRTTNGTNTFSERQIGSTQQDFHAAYSVFNSVSRDFAALYDISLTSAWATITINATISLVTERPFTATYTILNSVSQDFDCQYLVDGAPVTGTIPVQQDFAVVYAITDPLATIEVYRDFIGRWSAAGVVFEDFISEYQINADTASPGWNEITQDFETWAAVSTPSETWTPVTNPTGSWA